MVKVNDNPDKYSFAFTYDEFYHNMIKFLLHEDLIHLINPFNGFWAITASRNTIINEFKYAIGQYLCKERELKSLPTNTATACINVYRKLSGTCNL